jgi:hypothetical protein
MRSSLPVSSVLAGELDHPSIGLGTEQQLLDAERLVRLVYKIEVARPVDERWNAHGTCADVGVGAIPKMMGVTLIPVWMRACSTSFRKGSSGSVAQALRKSS